MTLHKTEDTQVTQLQERVRELEKNNNALAGQLVLSGDRREKAEAFSSAAKDALDIAQSFVYCEGLTYKLTQSRDPEKLAEWFHATMRLLSDAPPLPDVAAARELCDRIVKRLSRFHEHDSFLGEDLKLARRFLDSLKEKP